MSNDRWLSAKGIYTENRDGFNGGWSACDPNFNMFCVWVGEDNPAFISFSDVNDHYDDTTNQFKSFKVDNVDGVSIEIPPQILQDIAEAEYYWELT